MASARPVIVRLSKKQAEALLEGDVVGGGGHQQLHEALRAQLNGGNRMLALDDATLGQTIRLMTQYGSGGFQDRLRAAFQIPLIRLILTERADLVTTVMNKDL